MDMMNVSTTEKLTTSHQSIFNATAGATALDMTPIPEENLVTQDNLETDENKVTERKQENNQNNFENISLESASYLQNMESTTKDDDIPNFEVDSIELATPDLFSNNEDESGISNKEISQETGIEIFENSSSKENLETQESEMFSNSDSMENLKTKEPEMFENSDSDEDFEIPAFLRRQKN